MTETERPSLLARLRQRVHGILNPPPRWVPEEVPDPGPGPHWEHAELQGGTSHITLLMICERTGRTTYINSLADKTGVGVVVVNAERPTKHSRWTPDGWVPDEDNAPIVDSTPTAATVHDLTGEGLERVCVTGPERTLFMDGVDSGQTARAVDDLLHLLRTERRPLFVDDHAGLLLMGREVPVDTGVYMWPDRVPTPRADELDAAMLAYPAPLFVVVPNTGYARLEQNGLEDTVRSTQIRETARIEWARRW